MDKPEGGLSNKQDVQDEGHCHMWSHSDLQLVLRMSQESKLTLCLATHTASTHRSLHSPDPLTAQSKIIKDFNILFDVGCPFVCVVLIGC